MSNIVKIFFCIDSFFNRFWNVLILKRKRVNFHNKLRINGRISVYGDGEIKIGENVIINSCESSNPIGGFNKTILNARHGGFIHIGDNCGISNSAIVSYAGVTIGDNTFIGGSCCIYDTDFHSLQSKKRDLIAQDDVIKKGITIENNVFIGAHTIILKGITIGEESIVGAGSVVTKSIPPREIWGGNPARFIRKVEHE